MLPEWFFFAALTPVFWCLSNMIDQFVARAFTDSTLAGLVFIGLTSFPFTIGLFFYVGPDVVLATSATTALPIIACSALFLVAVYPYLISLKENDAGSAIPVFQTIPLFVFILGWLFLGETLTAGQGLAGLIMLLALVGLSWDPAAGKLRLRMLGLMLCASVFFAGYTVLLRSVSVGAEALPVTFWLAFGWTLCGGALMLVARAARNQVMSVVRKQPVVLVSGLLQEGFDIFGQWVLILALATAPTAVHVQLVGGLQAVYILFFALLFGWMLPRHFPRQTIDRIFMYKLACVAVTMVGLYGLLFWG